MSNPWTIAVTQQVKTFLRDSRVMPAAETDIKPVKINFLHEFVKKNVNIRRSKNSGGLCRMVKPGKLIFQGKTVNALCPAHALKKSS